MTVFMSEERSRISRMTPSPRVCLLLILVLAAALRFYALESVPPGITGDEATEGISARQALQDGLQVFYPENNGREGLYANLCTPLLYFSGNTVWGVRLPAAVFGVLCVWITYLLGRRWFGERIGLVAALFTATSTWAMFNSRLTNRANLAPVFLAAAVYLAFGVFDRISAGRAYAWAALLAGAVYGLGFHSYTSFRLTPLLVGGMWLWRLGQVRNTKVAGRYYAAAGLFALACVVVLLPLASYFVDHPDMFAGRASQISAFGQPNAAARLVRNCWVVTQMFFWRGDNDWKNNISGAREVFLPVALLFAAGAAICVSRARKGGALQDRLPPILLLAWLAMAALPSVLTIDEIHALRLSLMIPPVFLMAALGADWVGGRLSGKMPRILPVLAVVFFVAVCAEPVYSYFFLWAKDQNVSHDFTFALTDFAKAVRDAPSDRPKYVVLPNPVFGVYREVPAAIAYLTNTATEADRKARGIEVLMPTEGWTPEPRRFCAEVKASLPGGRVFCYPTEPPLAFLNRRTGAAPQPPPGH